MATARNVGCDQGGDQIVTGCKENAARASGRIRHVQLVSIADTRSAKAQFEVETKLVHRHRRADSDQALGHGYLGFPGRMHFGTADRGIYASVRLGYDLVCAHYR